MWAPGAHIGICCSLGVRSYRPCAPTTKLTSSVCALQTASTQGDVENTNSNGGFHTRQISATVTMWFWLIFTALAHRSLLPSLAEPMGNEIEEDIPNDAKYLYMEQRSLKDPKPDFDDIEARRRSPLDMNFMRFGKRDYLVPLNHYYDFDYNDDLKGKEDFVRLRRDSYKTSTDNEKDSLKRVGKGKDYTNFVRFGRNFYENLANDPRIKDINFGKRRDYTDFIRFGRNPYRDMSDIYREDKRHTNTMRFGKKSTGFMRFG